MGQEWDRGTQRLRFCLLRSGVALCATISLRESRRQARPVSGVGVKAQCALTCGTRAKILAGGRHCEGGASAVPASAKIPFVLVVAAFCLAVSESQIFCDLTSPAEARYAMLPNALGCLCIVDRTF